MLQYGILVKTSGINSTNVIFITQYITNYLHLQNNLNQYFNYKYVIINVILSSKSDRHSGANALSQKTWAISKIYLFKKFRKWPKTWTTMVQKRNKNKYSKKYL